MVKCCTLGESSTRAAPTTGDTGEVHCTCCELSQSAGTDDAGAPWPDDWIPYAWATAAAKQEAKALLRRKEAAPTATDLAPIEQRRKANMQRNQGILESLDLAPRCQSALRTRADETSRARKAIFLGVRTREMYSRPRHRLC